jgi:uncharacterized membrane protein YfcA
MTETVCSADAQDLTGSLPIFTLARMGFLGGVSGGLLGGGTGVVIVPALARKTRLARVTVHGTSLIPHSFAAIVGGAAYAVSGSGIDWTAGIALMIGGVAGAPAGARLAARVPDIVLKVLFVGALLLMAVKLLLSVTGLDPESGSTGLSKDLLTSNATIVAVGLLVGFIVGAWSAAMGLGGGLLTVPVMVMFFGAGLHTAEGTSLLAMLPNAITGALAHWRQRTIEPKLGFKLGLFAAPGALVGSLISLALSEAVLGIVFSVYVTFVAIREIWRLRVGLYPPTRNTLAAQPETDSARPPQRHG